MLSLDTLSWQQAKIQVRSELAFRTPRICPAFRGAHPARERCSQTYTILANWAWVLQRTAKIGTGELN